MLAETDHQVQAWLADGLLLEHHRYGPGPAGTTPAHTEVGYQICLSLDFPGSYLYRGDTHPVPPGAITVIEPGEVHVARDPFDRKRVSNYLMLYVPVSRFLDIGASPDGEPAQFGPTFDGPVISDPGLANALHRFHVQSYRRGEGLMTDQLLFNFLKSLLVRHAGHRTHRTATSRGASIARAKEYLDAHLDEDVRLATLASISGMSVSHFARSFRDQVGMPPHAYVISSRLAQARGLLAYGQSAATVAAATGFADQAHFTRHFKRMVGATPGRYARVMSKNVQDS